MIPSKWWRHHLATPFYSRASPDTLHATDSMLFAIRHHSQRVQNLNGRSLVCVLTRVGGASKVCQVALDRGQQPTSVLASMHGSHWRGLGQTADCRSFSGLLYAFLTFEG